MDFLKREYMAQSVAMATGATPKQITDWCNQGLITGQRKPLGRGHKRTFSWFNVMEVAGAMALMEIGLTSPGDAFRAAVHYSHFGEGGAPPWDDGIADNDPERVPGLPFHHNHGETYLLVSKGEGYVVLSKDGKIDPAWIEPQGAEVTGFVALNMSDVFARVTLRMGLDYREVLDEAYHGDAVD